MLALKIWNYMRGYVIITIEGLALERFINMCIARNIYLWDIRRINYTKIQAKISIKGFKEIRKIVRRTGCRVSISKKNGYPFWAHKLKKRKMLFIGAFFCLLLLIFSSTFIFNIEVVGNDKTDQAEIIEVLDELGLKPGVNKFYIDLKEIETQLLLNMEQLAWVGIDVKGIKAKVEVVEKRLPPDKIDKNIPCNMVAKKNGIIEEVISRNGDAVVKKGDIVSEGDLLISGIVQREHMEEPMFVHSYGEVYARTYYETDLSKSLIEIKNEKTGEKFIKKTLSIGGLQLSFNRGDVPFKTYITEKMVKRPFQWRNIGLPVEIIVEEYYETNEIEEKADEFFAKNQIHQEALGILLEQIPLDAEILNTQVDFTIQNNTLYGKVIIEVLENIAVKSILEVKED